MRVCLCITLIYLSMAGVSRAENESQVGPATEKRFPPLKVPAGFEATLFACDPLVEYPSVIALGPREHTLFVAHDYVTGLGVEIVRRDEVRLVEDTDQDGYADKSTVFAGEFNSIQGLAFYDGTVFVMHAPLLTSLRDTDDDGNADERTDIVAGLGLPPEENSNRLHCANGVVAGHDGWLYLALGDRGCDVQRGEGDRLLFQQGGILRCRHDGSDLHVFSTGLRNIYDVALDAELNVFVRDNENDGGDYMIRVNHCFFGSDHGYPYHYYERPDEAMKPLADLGRGSSAGGTSYLETAFPEEFRESLFFCEWGRAVVRYPKKRMSSSFEPMSEIDFAAGADDDPYGFKPTDLVVDRDGSLLISDWCDGQRPKRGRGRIYRITATNKANGGRKSPDPKLPPITKTSELPLSALIERLNSGSYHERVAAQLAIQQRGAEAIRPVQAAMNPEQLNVHGRLHAIWIIAQSGSESAVNDLFEIAESDPDATVRTQAVRAIGDLTDPVLIDDTIRAGRGNTMVAERLAKLAVNADPRVTLEVLTVFRRLRWCESPNWIQEHLPAEDPALDHAAQQALRHANHWPAVLDLLDKTPRLRKLALHAIAEQRVPYLATSFIDRLATADDPIDRREYIDILSRMARKEKPWTYWGFRPPPRSAATVDWKKTPQIVAALNGSLTDADHEVREFALQRMQRESISPNTSQLAAWLREESNEVRVTGILTAFETADASETRPILREAVTRQSLHVANRLAALSAFVANLPSDDEDSLLVLAAQLEDGPVLATVLDEFGIRAKRDATALLLGKLSSTNAQVRAAAIRSLGLRKSSAGREHIIALLDDESLEVKLAAAEAAGLLSVDDATDKLLTMSKCNEQALVGASLVSLRLLRDDRAVTAAVTALEHTNTQLAALAYLREFGTPRFVDQVAEIAATNHAIELQREVMKTLDAWSRRFPNSPSVEESVARVHGQSGQPLRWQMLGPLKETDANGIRTQLTEADALSSLDLHGHEFDTVIAEAVDASIQLKGVNTNDADAVWLAWSIVAVPEDSEIEMLTSASGKLSVWLDQKRVYSREKPGPFRPDSDRFSTSLAAGTRLIVAEVRPSGKPSRFHLRFRRRSTKADHERITQFALQNRGNVDRGREVFNDTKKSSCLQCHRFGDEGGKIGPDLAGIGSRFSRVHLIESILEPSRTIAPSYATVVVALNNGLVLAGVQIAEDTDKILLGDNQGKTHEIMKDEIDERSTQSLSTMPEGLEKKLTDREFLNLLAFLESQKKRN